MSQTFGNTLPIEVILPFDMGVGGAGVSWAEKLSRNLRLNIWVSKLYLHCYQETGRIKIRVELLS